MTVDLVCHVVELAACASLLRWAVKHPPTPDPMDGMRELVERLHRDAGKAGRG
jgi:hypothetical protein